MQAVLNSALPIFALILTGFICGFFGVFDRTATDNSTASPSIWRCRR